MLFYFPIVIMYCCPFEINMLINSALDFFCAAKSRCNINAD